jgi:hypothetical protein
MSSFKIQVWFESKARQVNASQQVYLEGEHGVRPGLLTHLSPVQLACL